LTLANLRQLSQVFWVKTVPASASAPRAIATALRRERLSLGDGGQTGVIKLVT
jgi:hypothetical protein